MKFLLLLFIVGCGKEVPRQVTEMRKSCIAKSDIEKLSKFIIECSKAANPLSDEEGEDLVAQCEVTGVRVICPVKKMCATETDPVEFGSVSIHSEWVPCD